MKKFKSFVAIALVIASLTSCSKEESLTTEVQNKDILSFNSEKEMNAKIAEIEKFKANQEAAILEKILKRNNLKAPTADDFKNIDNSKVTQLDEKAVLEDVKFYHTLKLEAIYAERAHFGFTSIQSIADEINFTKLVNPEKSLRLLNENQLFLLEENNIVKTVCNSLDGLIMNEKGKFVVNNNLIKQEQKSENSSRYVQDSQIKQGVLANNGIYAITWHVGVSEHKGDIGNNYYGNFTQFGSFIYGSLYPSWFYPTSNSSQRFVQIGTIDPIKERYVGFPKSAGSIVKDDDVNSWSTDYWNKYSPLEGFVSGTFQTVVGGQFVSISGTQIIN